MSESALRRIRELIYQRAGIVLAEHKRDMVYGRLGPRLRRRHLQSFEDYLGLLERDPTSPEWEAFTNALTTNLTSFFREAYHFPILAKHVQGQRHPIRVWCSAASTGQEPYSIAIQLAETLGLASDFQVLATDIDTDALRTAQRGVYSLAQVERLDERVRRRYFQKGNGRYRDVARVRPELAAHVRLEVLNLASRSWPELGVFDAIFCRNVMIYFDSATQQRILQKFVPLMRRNALLFVGHSESFVYSTDLFHLCGQTVYALPHAKRTATGRAAAP